MLHKLKHKLTLICTLSTTAIITIVTLTALSFSEKQLNKRNEAILESHLFNLVEHLKTQLLSHIWLAQNESNNKMIIDISSTVSSISFPGSYITGTLRNELIELAQTKCEEIYNYSPFIYNDKFNNASPCISHLYQDSNHYISLVANITDENITYQIILIQDMIEHDRQIFIVKIFFISLIVIADILLGLFSFWFAGKAIKPIAISQKEQIEFVAAASHELRSPLAVISTSVEELIEDERIPDKHFLHIINRECTQLGRLVNDLLFLSRTDSGYWQITFKQTEIDTLLLDFYDDFLPVVRSNEHFLELVLPDAPLPCISIDSERIIQTLSILINNALFYTPTNSHITLKLESFKHHLKIYVID
ncbi:MAG: HAMP domain-containing sensor histidine kinase, partial [Cellulosilyticum sp.]|nr:HAMP domain-containing sensor histidine kinase [Cellulosilyticum sp.]